MLKIGRLAVLPGLLACAPPALEGPTHDEMGIPLHTETAVAVGQRVRCARKSRQ